MLAITLICVGKLKEPYLIAAAREYEKRLAKYLRLDICEIPENNKSDLSAEAREIFAKIPKGAYVVALCAEGDAVSSEELADLFIKIPLVGHSKICLVVGGSNGLHDSVKQAANLLLSMSRMTFPHHLARVMLLEQIYRAATIIAGGKYHK